MTTYSQTSRCDDCTLTVEIGDSYRSRCQTVGTFRSHRRIRPDSCLLYSFKVKMTNDRFWYNLHWRFRLAKGHDDPVEQRRYPHFLHISRFPITTWWWTLLRLTIFYPFPSIRNRDLLSIEDAACLHVLCTPTWIIVRSNHYRCRRLSIPGRSERFRTLSL